VVDNVDLEARVGRTSSWIEERTGVARRHFASADTATSDLASEACLRALESAGVRAEDIDLIVVGTVTPDMQAPATAAFVQARIGAKRAVAFDVSAACAGFVYALSIVDKFFRAGGVKYALVVGADLLSRSLDFADPNTSILFGDGAGAIVLGVAGSDGARSPRGLPRGVLATRLYSDGTLTNALSIPGSGTRALAAGEPRGGTVQMRGQELFKVAVKNLHAACQAVLDDEGLHVDAIDWLLPHQANLRILEFAMKRIGVPRHKLLTNIKDVGNTSAASIPILWDLARAERRVRDGDLVLVCGLGAGVVWGSALVRQ
jgi:3-oxoacyl-[acyl-carrier-protein] synthase-3